MDFRVCFFISSPSVARWPLAMLVTCGQTDGLVNMPLGVGVCLG